MENNVFETLYAIDVNDKTEAKNGLTYLSWAWAWGEVKKKYPDAQYTIYENAQGWNYFTDGKTAWVKTGVTINGLEHIEYLPVMNNRNESIPLDKITSTAVNKAIQRSITKACARHGLGLYIYAGEDLPENAENDGEVKNDTAKAKKAEIRANTPPQGDLPFPMEDDELPKGDLREQEIKNILKDEGKYKAFIASIDKVWGIWDYGDLTDGEYKQLKARAMTIARGI